MQEEELAGYFKPHINNKSKQIKRGIDPLVEDATRRQNARDSLQQIMKQKANLEANRAYINTKSDKVLYDRFCRDFKEGSDILELGNEEDEAAISCAQMSNMFLTLGFVQPESSEAEQLLLANIWKLLGGSSDGNGEVLLWNIKVVMCCI